MPLNAKEEAEKIIRQYADMVYRLAYSYVHSKADAEDIFQETFLRMVRKAPNFESEEHCKAWLIRVTANCAKNYLNSAWKRHTQPMEELTVSDVPAEERRLSAALCELKPQFRAVIHLYYYEGYKTEEIARILGRKPSTIRSQLMRAREQLGKILKEES